jgi:hypothetical protein
MNDHDPFDVPVPPGNDEQDLEYGGDHASNQQRQPEEDLKTKGPAQQLCHVGGYACHDDAPAEESGPGA